MSVKIRACTGNGCVTKSATNRAVSRVRPGAKAAKVKTATAKATSVVDSCQQPFVELLHIATEALSNYYASDGMLPGILFSKVRGSYYCSFQRFHGARRKIIIARSYSTISFYVALEAAALKWLELPGPKIKRLKPVKRLSHQ
jgi:hypothetical protein